MIALLPAAESLVIVTFAVGAAAVTVFGPVLASREREHRARNLSSVDRLPSPRRRSVGAHHVDSSGIEAWVETTTGGLGDGASHSRRHPRSIRSAS